MSDLLGPSGNRMNTLSRLGLLFGATGAGLQGQLPQFQQSLMAQQDAIRQRLQQEQQQQALQALVTPRQIGLAGQAFGGTAPTQQEQMAINLLRAGRPQEALQFGNPEYANLLKGPQTPIKGSPGDRFFDPVTNKELFSVPAEPKPITNPKDAAFLQWSALNPNKNPAEFEAAWNSATQKQSGAVETYRMLTPQEAMARGLPDGFTYQVNERSGQITKLTEPKQDKPTQGENTSAYHAARIASGMQDLKEVLSRNKNAATTLVPGDNPLSRMMRGEDENIVQNALVEMGDALLTLGTGAAYTQIQFDNQWKANMPAVGDSDEIKMRKFARIEQLYERAKKNAGAAGVDLPSISSIAELYKPASDKTQQGVTATGPNGQKIKLVNGQWVPF